MASGAGAVDRLVLGALAGIVGTAAMTAAMRALHRRLDPAERYPLPPREITQRVLPPQAVGEAVGATTEPEREPLLRTATMAAHFAYGAAAGALLAAVRPRAGALEGAVYGVGVWAASYFGWIPTAGILRRADQHPARRNALMIGVHLVWGGVTALTHRELRRAEAEVFARGALADAPKAAAAPAASFVAAVAEQPQRRASKRIAWAETR